MRKLENVLSPVTGKPMQLVHELREVTFRKEKFSYIGTYWRCAESGEQFTEDWMDACAMTQVYNQYRAKYGIPFADEIKSLRENYSLSAAKMSVILGFGDNQYRLYENGEMPSLSNGRLLKSIEKAGTFRQFVEAAKEQLGEKEYLSIMQAVGQKELQQSAIDIESMMIFDNRTRGAENGYAAMNVKKLLNVMLYFIDHCGNLFNTKMNKLLFYLDMIAYRESGCAVTGLAYKAIQYGPVPVRWDRVYSMMEDIGQEIVTFESGAQGVKMVSEKKPDLSMFSEDELHWLAAVVRQFCNTSSGSISNISHEETAWKKAFEKGSLIDFNDSFEIKAL